MNIENIMIPENFAVEEAAELRERLKTMLKSGHSKFVLDFSKCTFIDSTGLGVLVSIYKKCMEQNGSMRLTGINGQVMKVFELTRLNKVFDIS